MEEGIALMPLRITEPNHLETPLFLPLGYLDDVWYRDTNILNRLAIVSLQTIINTGTDSLWFNVEVTLIPRSVMTRVRMRWFRLEDDQVSLIEKIAWKN